MPESESRAHSWDGCLVHGFKRIRFSLASDGVDITGLDIHRCSKPDFVADMEREEDRGCNVGSNKIFRALIDTSK